MATEHTENTIADASDASKVTDIHEATKRTRERSTIEFPYLDLDDAIEIAKAVHAGGGLACGLDKLAAELKQSANSGAFRLRVSNARVFGLTENERGESRLTELGRLMIDAATEAHARAESFLRVPLFGAIYDQYKGFTLPPPGTLESEMRKLGVAPKQSGRARQSFMRSAEQAGFFAYGQDKLIRPTTDAVPGTRPIGDPLKPPGKGNGSDGGDLPPLDGLILALVKKLPAADKKEWKVEDRIMWLQMAAMAFQMVYGPTAPIEIKTSDQTPTRSVERHRNPVQEGPSEVLPPINPPPPHPESSKQSGS